MSWKWVSLVLSPAPAKLHEVSPSHNNSSVQHLLLTCGWLWVLKMLLGSGGLAVA
jgi:hypothetical protein